MKFVCIVQTYLLVQIVKEVILLASPTKREVKFTTTAASFSGIVFMTIVAWTNPWFFDEFGQIFWTMLGTLLLILMLYFIVGWLVKGYVSAPGFRNFDGGWWIVAVAPAFIAWMTLAWMTDGLGVGQYLQAAFRSNALVNSGFGAGAVYGNILADHGWLGVLYGLCVAAVLVSFAFEAVVRATGRLFGAKEPRAPRPPKSPRAPKQSKPSKLPRLRRDARADEAYDAAPSHQASADFAGIELFADEADG